MDGEYIKARCREVAKADAALKVRPSAAAVALDYIIELEAKVERLENPGWFTYIELTKQWLANYPADIFDGSSCEPGPLFVVAIRNALAALEEGEQDV